ncbi:MAG TPA: hypothetical protein VFM55_23495 [Micromonosporaceae bacterium]|nr:hypothetical protein [Micromonosporaceae bacterium]
MAELAAFLLFAGGLAATMGGLVWLGSRIRRRGVGGEVMGPVDEIFHPSAHRFRVEIRVQEERMAPMPAPGDQENRRRPRPGTRGRSVGGSG